ncbi:hypothetical protein JTB14_008339 [Gonioctena quinquepunctata]|nr:hypothetical protein JTB14_008339 [Gonioctena quinquepunctata]
MESAIKNLREEVIKNRTEIKSSIEARETRLLLEIEEMKQKVNNLETENQILTNKVEILEMNSEKNNILIFGLESSEDISATSVTKKLKTLLDVNVNEADLNNLYRLNKSEKPPVKIEFICHLKKTEILKQTKKLKGTGIAISHDLTFKQRREQKILKTFLNRARENPADQSYIKGNKLYVNSKAYTVEELQEISYSEERSEDRNTYSAPATPNTRNSENELEVTEDIVPFQKSTAGPGKKSSDNGTTPKTSDNRKTLLVPMKERTRSRRSNK